MDLDVLIIKNAAKGDIASFERIYKALSPYVYTLVYAMMGNEPDSADVTQDVFLSIHKNLRYFNFRSNLKTWAHRIAVNTALNALAKRNRSGRRTVELDAAFDISSNELPAEETIAKKEAGEQVYRMLSALSAEQRACVVLRDMQGLSYKEIALATESNINTVRTRLKRARETLVELKRKGVIGYEV